ncbi:flagellar export chaperone FliS [Ligilactobacillus sp. WILCCON 0076]|uniref:Flagellar export chaperone FliS n=1 Tax=Ligilactobacillus ubinensis TaxID=2876789 RepID=A0A9X2JKN9_9LACO|nr:flagellar export chaperone FliS [Ligilactobacillus ubinensis]MCP0886214.1 flagellar export chaperone FliS [Ligilactobacillus ubinensis]
MGYGPKGYKNDYLKTEVMSASPAKLTTMLFEGAIKSIKLAQLAMKNKEIEKAHNYIRNAEEIIYELSSAIDPSVDKEIAQQLISLYDFSNNQLRKANISKDSQQLDSVLNVFVTLLNSWKKIAE